MSNKIKGVFFAVLISISLSHSAGAALIDNGSFTTDTSSGLDWLDLSVTNAQSYASAQNLNAGWRYATNQEVVGLFGVAFTGYTNTNTVQNYSDSNVSGSYAGQDNDVQNFISLFGLTANGSSVSSSLGFYMDENNRLRQLGVSLYSTYTRVYGDEYTADWTDYTNFGVNGNGVFMVRTSVVPLPAAAWLFFSGIIGLVGVALRRS